MSFTRFLYKVRHGEYSLIERTIVFIDGIFIISIATLELFLTQTLRLLLKLFSRFDNYLSKKLSVFKIPIAYIELVFAPNILFQSEFFQDLSIEELQKLYELMEKKYKRNDNLSEEILTQIVQKTDGVKDVPFSLYEWVWNKTRATSRVRLKALSRMKHTARETEDYIKVYAKAIQTESAHVIEKEMEILLESLKINYRKIKAYSLSPQLYKSI